MIIISKRTKEMLPSQTMLVTSKAIRMKAAGEDVLMLSAGEPDFDTPVHVVEAATAAMRRGETRYTIVDGTPVLKKAVCAKFLRESGLHYEPNQISIGAGGKQIISNAFLATVGIGDEVVIPAPYWVSYTDVVRFCEGTPVTVPTRAEDGYKLQPQALEQAITPATKWFVLNSPCNPTGAVYSRQELRGLADVLLRHPHVMIMSDDIYEHILYDGRERVTIAQVEPALQDRILIVNGVSKAYNMTGWRIGYGAGPAALIAAMFNIQGQLTSNPCSVSQAAALAALEGPQDFIASQVKIFQGRRDSLVAALNAIPGLSCPLPHGAFYVYPDCSGLIGAVTPQGKCLENDKDVVDYFLEQEKVACVHGAAFGCSPCFRLSYAVSSQTLTEACERMHRAVLTLKLRG